MVTQRVPNSIQNKFSLAAFGNAIKTATRNYALVAYYNIFAIPIKEENEGT